MKFYKSNVITLILIQLICNKSVLSYYNFTEIYKKLFNIKGPTTSTIVNAVWNGYSVLINEACKNDIELYIEGVHKQEEWALRMLDSSSHLQSGFLEGNIQNIGDFDQCLKINTNYNNRNIKGRLCRVTFEPPNDLEETYKYYHTRQMILGVCLPTNCEEIDVLMITDQELIFDSYTRNKHVYCIDSEHTKLKLNLTHKLIILFFIILMTFLIIGTVYDISTNELNKKKGTIFQILLSFSARNNLKCLLEKDNNPKSIKSLHGLRFISALIVLAVHRVQRDSQPLTNLFILDEEIRKWKNLILINGYIFVDVFFFIGGLLVSYSLINKYKKSNRIKLNDCLQLYLRRYIRITPPVVLMIMLTLLTNIFCLGYFCDKLEGRRHNCERYWYATLLYVHNFIDPHSMCVPQAWYLSADMQMFMFSPILLYIAAKRPKGIFHVLFSLIVMNTLTTFILSHKYKIAASNAGPFGVMTEKSIITYTPFYTRAGPWIIGFGLGLILQQHNKQQIKMKKVLVVNGWITAIICCSVSFFGMYPFVQYDHEYNSIIEPLYESLHRNLWAIGIGWIVFACQTGHGGMLNSFLSYETFHYLGKLSYCLYLTHPFIQQLQFGYVDTPRKFTNVSQISLTLGDLFYSIIFSLLAHIAVEAPAINIQKIIENKKGPETDKEIQLK
ncbi:nose resistant to fluoxetine protein 6-like [Lycorma delicatula]|uniref:nose resistant to fluoxetine protein 6-like n=1 Tax=Lycorma delicatula TaxID=130591 RepID=UPI003F50FD04